MPNEKPMTVERFVDKWSPNDELDSDMRADLIKVVEGLFPSEGIREWLIEYSVDSKYFIDVEKGGIIEILTDYNNHILTKLKEK